MKRIKLAKNGSVVPILVAATVAASTAFAAPAAASPSPSPRDSTVGIGLPSNNFPDAFAKSMLAPDAAPVGANDWSCTPSERHPKPVVLVHGTWENAYTDWSGVSPALKDEGYCVFALNYGDAAMAQKGGIGTIVPGVNGTAPIQESAKDLARYVDEVLAATGTQKVDIVAHSQGGVVARQYLKFEGGADQDDPSKNEVDNLVTLGATNHGTQFLGIASLDRAIRDVSGIDLDPMLNYVAGQAPIQQVFGSPLLLALNEGGDTVPGIDYTVIATRYDQVTNPYWWTFLEAGPGATVHNITLQDGCEIDVSDHLSMTYSPRAIDWIKHALDPANFTEADVKCAGNAPIGGRSDGGPLGTGFADAATGSSSSSGSSSR